MVDHDLCGRAQREARGKSAPKRKCSKAFVFVTKNVGYFSESRSHAAVAGQFSRNVDAVIMRRTPRDPLSTHSLHGASPSG